MSNQKTSKRTLTANIMILLTCIAMLIVATYAWFTDSASTGVNKIQSGKLDVALEMYQNGNWVSAEGETIDFIKAEGAAENEAILWEPGCTYTLPMLRVRNNENLALKYKIEITGIKGDKTLNDAIEWKIGDAALGTEQTLAKGEKAEFTIEGHMKEDAGNEYQDLSIDGISITVLATQDTVEYDSNDNQYDKDAAYAVKVSSASDLQSALDAGKDVILEQPINVTDILTVSSDTTIYGNGNTLSSSASRVFAVNNVENPVKLTLSGITLDSSSTESGNRGISLYGNQNVSLVVENSSISTSYYALCVAADNKNVSVSVKDSTLDGYSAFESWTSGTTANFENCTIIGNNSFDYNADGWNDYAAVVINTTANNCDLTFTNCRFENKTPNGNKEFFLSLRASGTTITLNNCSFSMNGTQLSVNDLLSNIEVYSGISNNTIVIDGTSYKIN